MAGPPPAGSDADRQRIAALALAQKTDAGLASDQRTDKPLPALDGKARKAEAWLVPGTPARPRKIVVTAADERGGSESTELYYNNDGLLQLARAADGLFVFDQESLAVWLDLEQKVKRGLHPSLTKVRVDAIMAEHRLALMTFGLR